MELFILRHGLAGEAGDPRYPDDSQRPLTAEGKRKMHQAALGMKAMGLEFDAAFTSPYLRARQTAEIVCKQLGCQDVLRQTNQLAPGGSLRALIAELSELPRESRVMLAGHEPLLSGLVSFLVSGDHGCHIEMKKGAMCKLEVGSVKYGRCAVLNWLMTGKQMAMAGV
jgi:phosphohistidine phosphatase